MALPGGSFEPGEGVAVARTRGGELIGFRDPETGRFISRSVALERVHFNEKTGKITDSFGDTVGVGAFRLPKAGASRDTEKTTQIWTGLDVDARSFRPGANQEIVEKVTVVDKEGKLHSFEISYGMGGRFNQRAPGKGGKWRFETSQALGLAAGERLRTAQLRKAVVGREFIVRTTTYK